MNRRFRSSQFTVFHRGLTLSPSLLLITLGVGLLASNLGGCALVGEQSRQPAPDNASPSATVATPSPIPNQPFSAGETPIAATGKTTTVTLYKVDQQCEQLIPEKASVAADRPMEAVVGQVIAQQSSADFNLAGYRLQVDSTRQEATIDFRLSPGSKRRFTSLSSCEQLALFGSLRRTLTGNPQWQIKTVKFTAQGQEIVL